MLNSSEDSLSKAKEALLSNQGYDEAKPFCVDFPLEGEWRAATSPSDKIPSHGTNEFGQRFAYDFINEEDHVYARKISTQLKWTFWGIPLNSTTGWKQKILSPVKGKIVSVQDGWPERNHLKFYDLIRAFTIGSQLKNLDLQQDFRPIGGNNIIIEVEGRFLFLAHFTTNSIKVRQGETVSIGQHVGNVGHTGNSTIPHLHIHLMDGPDLTTAKGLPLSFRNYEVFEGNEWKMVENACPATHDQLRSKV